MKISQQQSTEIIFVHFIIICISRKNAFEKIQHYQNWSVVILIYQSKFSHSFISLLLTLISFFVYS